MASLKAKNDDLVRSVKAIVSLLDEAQEYFEATFDKPLKEIALAKQVTYSLCTSPKHKRRLR